MRKLADRLDHLAKANQGAAQQRKEAESIRKQAEELYRNATPEQREQARRWAQDLAKSSGNPSASEPPSRSGESDGELPRNDQRATHSNRSDEQPGGGGLGGDLNGPRTQDAHRSASSETTTRMDTMDARPPTSAERAARVPERVIAEWYSNKKPAPGSGAEAAPLGPEAQQTVREAARSGERAVEEQAVPSRFDKLLLKYFKRLPERAADSGVPDPGAAKPAPLPAPAQDAPGAAPSR